MQVYRQKHMEQRDKRNKYIIFSGWECAWQGRRSLQALLCKAFGFFWQSSLAPFSTFVNRYLPFLLSVLRQLYVLCS